MYRRVYTSGLARPAHVFGAWSMTVLLGQMGEYVSTQTLVNHLTPDCCDLPGKLHLRIYMKAHSTYQCFSIGEGAQPRGHDSGEDPKLGGVLQLCKRDVVEVTGESGSDRVATTTRWTHGTNKRDVHQITESSYKRDTER